MNRPAHELRHALTLVEMLLALVLLAAIVTASAAWTQIAAITASSDGPIEYHRVDSAVIAVLDQIQLDIQSGDFAPSAETQRTKKRPPRVEVSEHQLTIRTRASGSGQVVHVYRFDAANATIHLVEQRDGKSITRPLLNDIKDMTIQQEADQQDFTIALIASGGREFRRRYRLP